MPANPSPHNPDPSAELGGLSCPIQPQAHPGELLDPAILRTLARIQRSTGDCLRCRSYQNCPILGQFNQAIDIALSVITEQWNLQEIIRR